MSGQTQRVRLPRSLKKYFWDADVPGITGANAPYVIERILEYGDIRAVRWLFTHATKAQIRGTLMKLRGFSPQTVNFSRIVLDIDKKKIACLKKSYIQMRKSHWIY